MLLINQKLTFFENFILRLFLKYTVLPKYIEKEYFLIVLGTAKQLCFAVTTCEINLGFFEVVE